MHNITKTDLHRSNNGNPHYNVCIQYIKDISQRIVKIVRHHIKTYFKPTFVNTKISAR